MASIKQQGNKHYVYYYHPYQKKPNGKSEQLYEDFSDRETAEKRKKEIEYQIKSGYFKTPSKMTIADYFKWKFKPLYATEKWAFKTWDTNMAFWNNDILPFFGKEIISKVKPADMDRFLKNMRAKKVRNMPKTPMKDRPYLTETTIRYVYTLVHCFFKMAVEWEDIEKSPIKATKPAASKKKRDFWQPERFDEVLAAIDDELLHLAIHIAFRCTLRVGEVCALDWDRVGYDSRELTIDRQIQRVTLEALDRIPPKELIHVFTPVEKDSQSRLILTTPKSDYGIRVNTMSEQLCEEFRNRERKVTMDKVRMGKKYTDHNLVFCYEDGRPMESGRISRKFAKWQRQYGIKEKDILYLDEKFPQFVDFHSIRISSTSYKMVVSGGDIKSAQSDLGDNSPDMVLSTYSRSLTKHYNAMNESFDNDFYRNADPEKAAQQEINNELLLQVLAEELKKPEFLETVLNALNTAGANKAQGAG